MVLGTGSRFVTNNDLIVSPKQRQAVDDYRGGFVDNYAINLLKSNELYDARNVIFDDIGSVETRPGLDGLLSIKMNAVIKKLFFFKKENTPVIFLAAYSNKIGKYNYTTKTFDDVITGFSNSSVVPDIVDYKNKAYIISQGDNIKVYDGSTYWDAGLVKPTSPPTVAVSINAPSDTLTAADAGSGSSKTGTFKYVVTFVTADGESGQSDASSQVTVASKDIALTNIPVGKTGEGVTARKIYRTKANGIEYYYLTTINDNTTTNYTDNMADSALGTDTPPDRHKLLGKYTYRLAFIYGERGESAPSDVSTSVELNYGQVKLTDIELGGTGCTARVIYRTIGGGGDNAQRLCHQIDDNTTTTYIDNIADADLTTVIDTDDNFPPKLKFGILRKKTGTLIGVHDSYPNRIVMSKSLYPEVFPAKYYINLPNTGDEITAIDEYNDKIYVFMKKHIYRISGDEITSMSVSPLSMSTGCVARNSLQHVRQDMLFLSLDGLFTMGRVLQSSSDDAIDVKPLSTRVGKTIANMNWSYASNCASYVYKNNYGIAIPYGSGVNHNNVVLTMNIDTGAFSKMYGKFGYASSFIVGDLYGTNDYKLYIGSSSQDGQVYVYPGSSYTDENEPYESYIITSLFTGTIPESLKRWKSFFVETELCGDWNLQVDYRKRPYTDDNAGWSAKYINLKPGYSVFFSSIPALYPVPGNYPIIGMGGFVPFNTILVATKGKSLSGQSQYLQFRIGTWNKNEHFKLYKLMLYYRLKKPKVS